MLYLLLAIVCSSLLSIVMRASEKHVKGDYGMLAVNYAICTMLAFISGGVGNLFPGMEGIRFTLGIGICTGILYLAGLLLVQLNIRKNGVVMASLFQKLGLIVQVLLSIIFFRERPEVVQVLGLVICLVAIVIINFEKEQTAIHFKIGLLLILFVSGLAEGMSKIHEELGNPMLSEHFLLYTFGTALILCVLLIMAKKERMGWKDVCFGILLGMPNYFSAKFLLKALNDLAAVVVFPTFSVATMVVISMAGLFIFKEKLSKKQWIGIGMILVALALLNI